MAYIIRSHSIHPNASACEDRPFLTATEPDYKTIITDANLRRRMSRIVKMGVACGLKCIDTNAPESIGSIITSTGLGCLTDTEKFMNNLLDNEEQSLNPTPFIQSTFNTVGSQIAQIKGIHGYNITHVHRDMSFENAFLDASIRLEEEEDKSVLVGAFDELTPTGYTICQRLGMYKKQRAGEGATFFLLSSTPDFSGGETPVFIEIHTIHQKTVLEGVAFQIGKFLEHKQLKFSKIDYFVTNVDEESIGDYAELTEKFCPLIRYSFFKQECGEYPTSTAYAVWKTEQELKESELALIYIHHKEKNNHSFIFMHKCS